MKLKRVVAFFLVYMMVLNLGNTGMTFSNPLVRSMNNSTLCAAAGSGIKKGSAKKANITLTTKFKLYVGKTGKIKVTAHNKSKVLSKKYKSANKKIATVNKSGKITAKKAGSTKITVTVKYRKSGKVKIVKKKVSVTVKNRVTTTQATTKATTECKVRELIAANVTTTAVTTEAITTEGEINIDSIKTFDYETHKAKVNKEYPSADAVLLKDIQFEILDYIIPGLYSDYEKLMDKKKSEVSGNPSDVSSDALSGCKVIVSADASGNVIYIIVSGDASGDSDETDIQGTEVTIVDDDDSTGASEEAASGYDSPADPQVIEDYVVTSNEIHCYKHTPQGICYTDKYLIIAMYCSDNIHNSCLMFFDRNTHKYICEAILPFKIHTGGITYDGVNIYVPHIASDDATYFIDEINLSVFEDKLAGRYVKSASSDASGDASGSASSDASGSASSDASGSVSGDASGNTSGDASADAISQNVVRKDATIQDAESQNEESIYKFVYLDKADIVQYPINVRPSAITYSNGYFWITVYAKTSNYEYVYRFVKVAIPSSDASGEASGEASSEASGNASGEASSEASGEASSEASGNASGEASSDASGNASGEASSDASGEASSDASSKASGEASAEASGDASGDPEENMAYNVSTDMCFSRVTGKYKLPNRAQSIAFSEDGNALYVVRSLGRSAKASTYVSQIEIYDFDESVSAYTQPRTVIIVPPMIEQVTVCGDELFMLFESGSYIYSSGANGTKKCLTPIEAIIAISGLGNY